MSIRDFTKINSVRATIWHGGTKWTLSDWGVAAGGELGEACNVIKKLNRLRDGLGGNKGSDTEESLKAQLIEELADTVTYIDLLASELDLDLWDAIRLKFNKVSEKVNINVRLPDTIFEE